LHYIYSMTCIATITNRLERDKELLVEYGGKIFIIPQLSKEEPILFTPKRSEIRAIDTTNPIVRDINTIWKFEKVRELRSINYYILCDFIDLYSP
jgi:hypothetical protein